MSSQRLRTDLVSRLLESHRCSRWLSAFAHVPREVFVPYFYRQGEQGRWQSVTKSDPDYLTTIYSDIALTTQLDDHDMPVSSSSQPSLMLAMLDALDAELGHRALEIGTGTGYNAALLCHRLGDDALVTVDIDPDLTTLAGKRLSECEYDPRIVTGDGTWGYEAGAPYDRVVATVGLSAVPRAVLNQVMAGGIIVAPVGFGIARLTVTGAGEAEGRFLPVPAHFMPLRARSGRSPDLARAATEEPRRTAVPIEDVLDHLRWPLSLALPAFNSCSWRDDDGKLTGVALWTDDGSTATADASGTVRQIGPRRLWDVVEHVAEAVPRQARREEFGITINPEGQHAWYWSPNGLCWPLPGR